MPIVLRRIECDGSDGPPIVRWIFEGTLNGVPVDLEVQAPVFARPAPRAPAPKPDEAAPIAAARLNLPTI